MSGWAWYEEGGIDHQAGSCHDTPLEATEAGVLEIVSTSPNNLHNLRVGPVRTIADMVPGELLSAHDVESLDEDGRLTPEGIRDCIARRYEANHDACHCERCRDRSVRIRHNSSLLWGEGSWSKVCERWEQRCGSTSGVFAWVREHVVLEPESLCSGTYPLPLLLVDYQRQTGFGQWIAYAPEHLCIWAMVDYQVNEDETGLTGWIWRVDGDFGSASTLDAAMEAAESLLRVP